MYYINNDIITTEKFDMIKFMELGDDMVVDSLSSYVLYQIPYLPIYGNYTIDNTTAERPDLLSHILYGDTQYWWILMWYNHLLSPKDLKVGLRINYPGIGSIEQLYMNTSVMEKLNK